MLRAEQRIKESYKNLVTSLKKADVSVAEICREANLSRKTFYNYYNDRYDLLKQIMLEEIAQPMRSALRATFSYSDILKLMFMNFLLQRDFYMIVMQEDGQNSLFESMVEDLTLMITAEDSKPDLTETEMEYVNYRYAVNLVMTVRKWMRNGMRESPERMCRVFMYPTPIK